MLSRIAQSRKGRPLALPGKVGIVRNTVLGKHVLFAITIPGDSIQKTHRQKGFYEPEELEIIRGAFPAGGTFLDIGANVGNHSLFVALFLSPEQIIAVEPNRLAYEVLFANLTLNSVEHLFDLDWIGLGISDQPGSGFGVDFKMRNVGGGKLVEGEGEIDLVTGDEVVGDRRVDFIKIDVEGMEIQALNSLEKTVVRNAPRIFVEVDNQNRDAFFDWCKSNEYRAVANYRRYKVNENFLIVHEGDDLNGG